MSPFRKPHTVRTPSAGRYVNGEWVEGSYTETTIQCSVQAIKSNQEVEALAEGRRITDYRRIYTDAKLQTSDDDHLKSPAIIVIDGFEYEVKQRAPWQNGLIPHYMYYVVRKYDG